METKNSHNCCYIFTLVVCFVTYCVNLAINALAGSSGPPLFYNNTGDISDLYALNITPAGWTFSIWGIIYTWQVLWFAYAFSTLCRRGVNGGHLYYSPTLLPVHIYIIYIINCVALVTWLVVWDRSAGSTTYLVPAFVVIAMMPLLGFLCVFLNVRAIERHRDEIEAGGLMREVWLLRFLFQNGVACFTTWVAIATLLNLATMLHYHFRVVDVYTAGSISLGLLSAEVITWFILDVFVFDRYTRYVFIPYGVLVWALTGAVLKNYPHSPDLPPPADKADINPVWLVVLLSLSGLLLLLKLAVMIWRHCQGDRHKSASKEDLRKSDQFNANNQYVSGSYNVKV